MLPVYDNDAQGGPTDQALGIECGLSYITPYADHTVSRLDKSRMTVRI